MFYLDNLTINRTTKMMQTPASDLEPIFLNFQLQIRSYSAKMGFTPDLTMTNVFCHLLVIRNPIRSTKTFVAIMLLIKHQIVKRFSLGSHRKPMLSLSKKNAKLTLFR